MDRRKRNSAKEPVNEVKRRESMGSRLDSIERVPDEFLHGLRDSSKSASSTTE